MEAGYCRGPGPSRAVAPQMMIMMIPSCTRFSSVCILLVHAVASLSLFKINFLIITDD
jgi:hypothetical protein